jgi:hypothetical protein
MARTRRLNFEGIPNMRPREAWEGAFSSMAAMDARAYQICLPPAGHRPIGADQLSGVPSAAPSAILRGLLHTDIVAFDL